MSANAIPFVQVDDNGSVLIAPGITPMQMRKAIHHLCAVNISTMAKLQLVSDQRDHLQKLLTPEPGEGYVITCAKHVQDGEGPGDWRLTTELVTRDGEVLAPDHPACQLHNAMVVALRQFGVAGTFSQG